MRDGFLLGSYLLLVDYTGRLFREGKATNSAELMGTFDRWDRNPEVWQSPLNKLSGGRLQGRFFSSHRKRCAAWGTLGHANVANLDGCLAE